MSYRLKVLKDNPLSFWPLDETSGYTAYDSTDAQNNATYNFTLGSSIMPLTPGAINGVKISGLNKITVGTLNGPNGTYAQGNLADIYSSDTPFSIECWVQMNEVDSATIFADQAADLGLYWSNNSVIFSLSPSKKITYLVPEYKESIYIVATYSNDYMKLYINGDLVEQSRTTDFKFVNETFSPQVGTVSGGADSYMIIDAAAIYRREIGIKEISSHFSHSHMLTSVEIADPENGRVFSNTDATAIFQLRYQYGVNRDLKLFQNSDLEYDDTNKCIKMIQTNISESKTTEKIDVVSVPLFSDALSSKIEWSGENGISVYTSSTGIDNSYIQCQNGFPIPQYQFNDFDTTNLIYIKVVYSSTDTSIYIPRLYSLNVVLYSIVEVSSSNSSATLFSDKNISIGSNNKNALLRNRKSGIRTGGDNSFSILDSESIQSIEMIYTPESVGSSTLISRGSESLGWSLNGNIQKSGIDSLYINGVLVGWNESVWDYFTLNQPSHIIVNFSAAGTDRVIFNSPGIASKYQNITAYSPGNTLVPIDHYNMYCGTYSQTVSNESMTLSEIGTPTYDYDFVVLKTV